jgi:uncharacterized membrane protein YphA (DoxX/SURF4 family)
MKSKKSGAGSKTSWLLRLGLAFVFGYVAIASLVHPNDWVGYLPQQLKTIIPALTLLKLFSIYEILLALWLLSGKFVKIAALVTAMTLAGIVVTNPSQFAITFRDVGLIFAALALFFTK